MDGSTVASKPRSQEGKLLRVRFGSVTVTVTVLTPTKADFQHNVDRSTKALSLGLRALFRNMKFGGGR